MANTTETATEKTSEGKNAGLLFSILIAIGIVILLASQVIKTGDRKATDIRDSSLSAREKVSSYGYNIAIQTDSMGFIGGNPITVNGSTRREGVIDMEKKFMHETVSEDVIGIPEEVIPSRHTRAESYVVNTTLYLKVEDTWLQQEMTEDVWNQPNLQQKGSVIKGANVMLIGTEDFRGEQAYVLEIRPDLGILMAQVAETGSTPFLNERLSNEQVQEYVIHEWISKESLLPLKSINKFTLASDNVTTTMSVLAEYYDYNKAVNTELPEEAADAMQM